MQITYLVKCDRMPRAERLIVVRLDDFVRQLERLMQEHGPIELLYQESSRA